MQIIVVGAGVIGMTTAVVLQEAGYDVEVWARELAGETHSMAAGAVWYPTALEPRAVTRGWAKETLEQLYDLCDVPESGVRDVAIRRYFYRRMGAPWWRESVEQFALLRKERVVARARCGYAFVGPVVEMRKYLAEYLPARFEAAGGKIWQREVRSLEEPLSLASFVVNCSGIGARELASDDSLYPVRGQVTRVPVVLSRAVLCDDAPQGRVYVVPGESDTVVGVTAERGKDSLVPDDELTERMLARASRLVPELADKTAGEARVGLRPGRPSVRLEWERRRDDGRGILHHYGHGGAGLTLSWGAARAALALIDSK